jgi:transcriptional regulator with GAF, ATPase, and Fis domain
MLAEATRLIEVRFQRSYPGEEIIGESPALKEVSRQVEVVALRTPPSSSMHEHQVGAKPCFVRS